VAGYKQYNEAAREDARKGGDGGGEATIAAKENGGGANERDAADVKSDEGVTAAGEEDVAPIQKSNLREELDAFMAAAAEELPHWPAHVLHYLRMVMIARGGAKALSIRSETVAYLDHLQRTADGFSSGRG
jgi:hypothetical protein